MGRHRIAKALLGLAVVAMFVLHAAGYLVLPGVQRLEHLAYDLRVNLSLAGGVDPRIVIADIDEPSLAREGQWPWSRDRLADLVDRLFDDYHVALLGFDVTFPEPDRSSGLISLQRLAAEGEPVGASLHRALEWLRPRLEFDRLFAESLEGRPVVLGYFFSHGAVAGQEVRVGRLPPPVALARDLGDLDVPWPALDGYGANLDLIQASALAAGFFNSPLVDADGIYRRVPLLLRYGEEIHESLVLAMVRALLGSPAVELVAEAGYGSRGARLEALDVGGLHVPVDHQAAALVPYRGRHGSFPYVSAADVLAGEADPAVLDGAIVLIGTSAGGLMDLRPTPVQALYPGVEVNANLIAGILDQSLRHRPAYATGLEILALSVLGALGVALGLLTPLRALLGVTVLVGLTFAANLYAWEALGLVLALAPPLLMLGMLYVMQSSYGFLVEARHGRQMQRLFGQYVPPELVEEMSRAPGRYALEGDSRVMTVLFSDVAGFTTVSEGLEPAQLTRLMQAYLTPMTAAIHEHRGTIDKYIGDAIMAFWGAPIEDPDHARHAVAAALEMVRRLEVLGDEFEARGWPRLAMRIGINTGPMSVGNMGSQFRMAYTVLGDAVNLASRLEGTGKVYGVSIVVSESTREAVPDHLFRELDRVRVKGREAPVAIYEPVGPRATATTGTLEDLARHDEALDHYRAQRWEAAEALLRELARERPALYGVYLQRIERLRADPPGPDWDGVFTMETK